MNISNHDLAAEFYRARAAWPFIDEVERRHGLPRCLLYAVGSRETNLGVAYTQGKTGDGGHGHGVWQFDTHPQNATPERIAAAERIDGGDVEYAADVAASMLVGLYKLFGDWTAACNAYNSGQPQTSKTTGHDYGPDVMARCRFLADLASPPAPPAPPNPQPVMELDVQIAKTAKTAWLSAAEAGIADLPPNAGYELHADGGIENVNGAPFYGGYFNKPESVWKAPQPERTFLVVTPRDDGQPGYVIWATDGAFYGFGPDGWDPQTQAAA